uniref:Ig-like domain-containing protein n=1 Tax=Callorhinchus milii TaxID=7868 RepID=A0A4W3GBH7_CALMI
TPSFTFGNLLFTDVQSGAVMTQPPTLIGKTVQALRLTCRISGFNLANYWMHWKRQFPGKQRENFLAYFSSSNYFESEIENRVTVIKDTSKNIFDVIIKSPTVEDTATYYCGARSHDYADYWGQGTKVTVTDVVILTQSSPEDIVMHNLVTAVCFVSGFHPDKLSVKWLKDWQSITSGVVNYPSVKEDNGTFSTNSRLTVPASEWRNGTVYTCQVSHEPTQTIIAKNITKIFKDNLSLTCVKIYLLPPAQRQVLMESSVTLTCVVANAPLHVNVTWTQENTHLHHGGMRTPIREQIFKKIGEQTFEHTKQPSVYLLLPSAEELSAQQSVTLTCLVKNFAPKEIFVQWTVNDQVIDSSNYQNTDVMADSASRNYSTYSMLSISAEDWDRGNSYSCVVGHETFPLKTLTRSVNKFSGKTSFVNISVVLKDTVNACDESRSILFCLFFSAPASLTLHFQFVFMKN